MIRLRFNLLWHDCFIGSCIYFFIRRHILYDCLSFCGGNSYWSSMPVFLCQNAPIYFSYLKLSFIVYLSGKKITIIIFLKFCIFKTVYTFFFNPWKVSLPECQVCGSYFLSWSILILLFHCLLVQTVAKESGNNLIFHHICNLVSLSECPNNLLEYVLVLIFMA